MTRKPSGPVATDLFKEIAQVLAEHEGAIARVGSARFGRTG
jgi:hypothetical protein